MQGSAVQEVSGGGQQAVRRVDLRGLVKTFGATVALRGVSGAFDAGELTIVEGANGSGKSTLLGIVGTVIRPTSGTVNYAPFDIQWGRVGQSDDVERVRSVIGWVSHETLAYPDLSGRQNVELAARIHGLDVGDAWRRAEERFELATFAKRATRTYSRGQRQRIALARALVHEPMLVLLDEPTAGLDRAGVARLLAVLGEELTRGAMVVVVSHEPALFVERASDVEHPCRRIVLSRGKLESPQA